MQDADGHARGWVQHTVAQVKSHKQTPAKATSATPTAVHLTHAEKPYRSPQANKMVLFSDTRAYSSIGNFGTFVDGLQKKYDHIDGNPKKWIL
jgi:hypothetical protein